MDPKIHPQIPNCSPIEVAFGVDKQGRPIHLQKAGVASHRFAEMYSFAGQNVPKPKVMKEKEEIHDVGVS